MDRERYRKIKKYLVIYVSFSLLFATILYAQIRCEREEQQRRILTLLVNHPEWEAEIVSLWYKSDESFVTKGIDQGTSDGMEQDIDQDLSGNLNEERLENALQTMEENVEKKYGHDLKCILPQRSFLVFWGTGMLAGAVLTVLLAYWEKHRKNGDFEFDETYHELRECLEQFQRGNFRQIPEYDNISEARMKLWETVRELGVYFHGLKERLREEEDSTKALITDISHQLKTPLASLRMSYELVTGNDVTEEERKEFQEQEAREIRKLETLLAELVNLSRLEKHMIQIRLTPASLKNTITNAVSQIYMKARNKDIGIQVEMEQDFEICHDGKWTAEAIVNILDNAVKYSDEHTMVTVRVQPLIKNVLIEIEDEGMGIRPEELVKIYQRFYRGSEAEEKVREGAGVGLYLARMILERQGGTITAKRRPDRGTVFRVTLPGVTAMETLTKQFITNMEI
ncbi:MAG: HAMP domain-containing histidine kinase [Acetatifactor sp.]|nr:HAMP domain-containing histidine kinase [Acetatifactor sp.]